MRYSATNYGRTSNPATPTPHHAVLPTALKIAQSNSTTLLDQALALIALADLDFFIATLLTESLRLNALPLLSHLATTHAVSFAELEPAVLAASRPSIPTLNFLLAHGWDVNYRRHGDPFLWHMVSDEESVRWCLENGARVDFKGERRRAVTERVAKEGSVEVLKMVRDRGAPLGRRTLHLAVEAASWCYRETSDAGRDAEKDAREDAEKDAEKDAQKATEKPHSTYLNRLSMIHFLLNTLHLDINAADWAPGDLGFSGHSGGGTPICYAIEIMHSEVPTGPELTWLLLDHGADPTPALVDAERYGFEVFGEWVRVWRERRERMRAERGWREGWMGRGCCVQ